MGQSRKENSTAICVDEEKTRVVSCFLGQSRRFGATGAPSLASPLPELQAL